ncbi:hypothetical protein LY78DRAFT_487040 [Colletotrichum sublineola]|nr:hypothetical protein LY78DRAFT_487040 [Colletotrichum sublineola]
MRYVALSLSPVNGSSVPTLRAAHECLEQAWCGDGCAISPPTPCLLISNSVLPLLPHQPRRSTGVRTRTTREQILIGQYVDRGVARKFYLKRFTVVLLNI